MSVSVFVQNISQSIPLRIFKWKIQKLEQLSNQNYSQPRKDMFLPQMMLKTTIEKLQTLYKV